MLWLLMLWINRLIHHDEKINSKWIISIESFGCKYRSVTESLLSSKVLTQFLFVSGSQMEIRGISPKSKAFLKSHVEISRIFTSQPISSILILNFRLAFLGTIFFPLDNKVHYFLTFQCVCNLHLSKILVFRAFHSMKFDRISPYKIDLGSLPFEMQGNFCVVKFMDNS